MTGPVRLQLSRRKGFNLQDLSRATNGLPAVTVARPTLFGNPFSVLDLRDAGYRGTDRDLRRFAVHCYRDWLNGGASYWTGEQSDRRRAIIHSRLSRLRGKNLACWCPVGQPCHADVLLELANGPRREEA